MQTGKVSKSSGGFRGVWLQTHGAPFALCTGVLTYCPNEVALRRQVQEDGLCEGNRVGRTLRARAGHGRPSGRSGCGAGRGPSQGAQVVKTVRPLEVLAGPELEAAKAQPHHSGEVRGLKDAGGTGVIAIAPHVVEGRGGLVALSLLAGEQVDSEWLDASQVALGDLLQLLLGPEGPVHVWQFLSRLHVVHDHVGQIGAGVLGLPQVGCYLVDVDLHLLDELAGRVLLPAKKVEHVAPVVVAGDGLCQLVRLVCSSGGAYHEALLGRHEAFCVVLAGCGQGLPSGCGFGVTVGFPRVVLLEALGTEELAVLGNVGGGAQPM